MNALNWLASLALAPVWAVALLCCPLPGAAADTPPDPPVESPSETRINAITVGEQRNPALAVAPDGHFVVVWEEASAKRGAADIRARMFEADGQPRGDEFRVNSFADSRQAFPAVAINASGAFIVAWDSNGQDDLGLNVYAQRYAADGTPAGGEFRVNNGNRAVFSRVGVALDDQGIASFVWPERLTPLPLSATRRIASINVRRHAADNTALGNQFEVATATPTNLRLPSIAGTADGGFVVTWQATGAAAVPFDGVRNTPSGIHGRRYSASGAALGEMFQIDTPVAGEAPDRPNLAVAADGRIAFVWQRNRSDLTPTGSWLRLYDAAGVALGPEQPVDPGPEGSRLRAPAVAFAADGSFTVVAAGGGIHVRRYGGDGLPLGQLRRVDRSEPGADSESVLGPVIGIDAAGGARVVWSDFGAGGDGDSRGIVSQRLPIEP